MFEEESFNPQSVSSYGDIFISCRRGDLERVRYLTEEKEINLNVRDQWDSTPLYYACLCGHLPVVIYLIENGARCDASTFDGERCVYGALTEQIRKTLQNYSVLTSRVKRRERYQEFLRRLLEEGSHSDITFSVHGTNLKAHRFILAARSEYFQQMLDGKWSNRERVSISNALVDPTAFYRILEWLYTGQVKLNVSQCDDVLRLCKQCKLQELEDEIQDALIKADSFVSTKRGTKIVHVQVESETSQERLQQDLAVLAQLTLPQEFQFRLHYWKELPLGPWPISWDSYVDVIFNVHSHLFFCHKVMFWTRSEYFRALIDDHFHEGRWDTQTDRLVIPINNISPEVFAIVVSHIYSNMQQLTVDNVYETMEASEMLLLPDLKRQCGVFLGSYLEPGNVVDLLRTARLFDIPRLEHQCIEFAAKNIEEMVENDHFRKLVLEDARSVKERQETDSIDIIDEIRYILRTSLNSLSSIGEAERKLEILHGMLDELDLEA